MKLTKMHIYAPEGAVGMGRSFIKTTIVLAGCWYSYQRPIDFVFSWVETNMLFRSSQHKKIN